MTQAQVATDPIMGYLLDGEMLVRNAAAVHHLTLKKGGHHTHEVELGTFELTPNLIKKLTDNCRFSWSTEGEREKKDVLRWQRHHASLPAHLRMEWPHDKRPMLTAVAFLRANSDTRTVEALPDIREVRDRFNGKATDVHAASMLYWMLAEQHPNANELFRRLAGTHSAPIARFDEIGYGQLRTTNELFQEFAAEHPGRSELVQSKLSPFRPTDAWGLYVPEVIWPVLRRRWAAQLREFKRRL
jgi:hypothetical protein